MISGNGQTEKVGFDLKGLSVAIGMPTARDLHPFVVQSLLKTQRVLDDRQIPLDFNFVIGCSLIEQARSRVVGEFLKGERNRLLWIDSDQTFEPEDVIRLLCLSTEFEIVGAVYPDKSEPPTFAVATTQAVLTSGKYGCLELDGMGLGFCMFHRHVIETMAERAPKVLFRGSDVPQASLFRCRVNEENGEFVGEDIAFFKDCREAGFRVMADPSMEIGHLGMKVYGGSLRKAMLATQGAVEFPTSQTEVSASKQRQLMAMGM